MTKPRGLCLTHDSRIYGAPPPPGPRRPYNKCISQFGSPTGISPLPSHNAVVGARPRGRAAACEVGVPQARGDGNAAAASHHQDARAQHQRTRCHDATERPHLARGPAVPGRAVAHRAGVGHAAATVQTGASRPQGDLEHNYLAQRAHDGHVHPPGRAVQRRRPHERDAPAPEAP